MARAAFVISTLAFLLLAGCSSNSPSGNPTDDTPQSTPTTSQSGPAPRVVFTVDESLDRLAITFGTDSSADWNRIEVKPVFGGFGNVLYMGDSASGGYQNELASVRGIKLDASTTTRVTTASEPLYDTQDEFVEFCADGQVTDVTIKVYDVPSKSLIGDYKFLNVAACP